MKRKWDQIHLRTNNHNKPIHVRETLERGTKIDLTLVAVLNLLEKGISKETQVELSEIYLVEGKNNDKAVGSNGYRKTHSAKKTPKVSTLPDRQLQKVNPVL